MELFIFLDKFSEDRGCPAFLWRVVLVLVLILILISILLVFALGVSKVLGGFELNGVDIFWRFTKDVTIVKEPGNG